MKEKPTAKAFQAFAEQLNFFLNNAIKIIRNKTFI